MKGRCVTVVLMLLALAVACMVSAPVISAEHPWDADGGGEPLQPGDPPPDTIGYDEDGNPITASSPLWWYWLYQVYYQTTGQG